MHRQAPTTGLPEQRRLNTICPQCGTANAVQHRFCHFCGYQFASDVLPPAPTVPRQTPGEAVSRAAAGAQALLAEAMQELGRQAVGALPLLAAAFPGRAGLTGAAAASRIRLWEVAVLAVVTFVALVLRVQNLETTPSGIANTEAELALEALRLSRGETWPGAWTAVAQGAPAGMVYLQALLFLFFDAGIATARSVPALAGVALIPVAYLLMRQLFSARTAILTTAFVTFHIWFLVYSRIALPAMPAVFCFAAGVWLLIAGVRSNRPWVAGLGGGLFGLGWYTYQAFPLYAAAIWGLLILLLVIRKDTRRREVYWFLGASVAVSAYMIFLYVASDAVGASLRLYDRTSLAPPSLISRAWEVVTYVRSPIPREVTVGTGGIPLLHFSTEVFFWIGVAGLLCSIRRRSSQLLLAGWLISLVPAVLVPDAESRRYLLGIFFVLAIAAAGLDTVLSLAHDRWKAYAGTLPIPILAGWFGNAAAALVLAAFVLFFAAQQSRDYDNWLAESEWDLARAEVEAVRFAQSLGDGYEVRLYSDRVPSTSAVVQLFLSDTQTMDGSAVFGGRGDIDAESVDGPTAWLLSESYLALIPALESTFPQGRLTYENSERGELLYAAYVLDAS